jgi:tRNA uridine 5-carbamoylmethylation protein Kti12
MNNFNSRKLLYIIRGIPGSGKSTLARQIIAMGRNATLTYAYCEADMFFIQPDGTYKFDPTKIGAAHNKCFNDILNAMKADTDVCVVANTFTTLKEMQPYIDLAKNYDYELKVVRVVSKNYDNLELDKVKRFAGYSNEHSVPMKTLAKMADRFADYDGETIVYN